MLNLYLKKLKEFFISNVERFFLTGFFKKRLLSSTMQVHSLERIFITWPCELLSPFVYPEVGDPLSSCEDGTCRVSCSIISLPVLMKVVPEHSGSLDWLEADAKV